MDFIEELRWRGMLHDMIPGTEDLLKKGMVTGYIGFDPTANSLHVGNLAQIMTLIFFQKAGHKPMALVGGATGMVGDPSGRSDERNLLDETVLQKNLEGIKKQLEKFLDFNSGANSAVIVNNYDWFKNYSFLDFIREAGKYITVNYMLAKDSVQKRLESGMSFTEFSYQLIQGFDFYYLWKNNNVQLQMGGSDQWGNIVTGTEFIRRKESGEAFALTTQLIKKADGSKFGKSLSGNIWLDAAKTSPYKFYQFWLNATDNDAANYMKIFTLKDKAEIEALIAAHNEAPHLRSLQKSLAADVTARVHGDIALQKAIDTTNILFGNSIDDFKQLTPEDVESAFDESDIFTIPFSDFENSDLLQLLAEKSTIYASKGEARKALQQNAVSVNKNKVSIDFKPSSTDLLFGSLLLIQKGKKNYYLIKVIK